MAALEREIQSFEQRRSELEAAHMGKWVLFHGSDLIGVYPDFELAAEDAVKRFGRGPYLIRQVGNAPMTLPASVMYHPLYGDN